MFVKYTGKLGKCEAEAVQEVLDMVDGDEVKARTLVCKAARGLDLPGEIPAWFPNAVKGMFFANQDWWFIGLIRLGILKEGDSLQPIKGVT